MASIEEMYADLDAADASGDTQLAQTIANQIKSFKAPKGASAIPTSGYQQAPAQTWETPRDFSAGEGLVGLGEAGLNLATSAVGGSLGMAGGFLGALGGAIGTGKWDADAIEAAAEEGAQKLTYEPRTQAGRQYAETAGKALMETIPVGAIAHTLPPVTRRPSAPKAKTPTTKLDALEAELSKPKEVEVTPPGEAAFNRILEEQGTGATTPYEASLRAPGRSIDVMADQLARQGEAQRTSAAQAAIDARQLALEQDIARQGGLARNAAERARMEQAPTGYAEWVRNRELADIAAATKRSPIETVRQMELFDQSEQGRVANPYEAAVGDWRLDENGMPIKADLSMELQNLENPLQRNIWGDELDPTRPPEGMGLQGVITGEPQGGVPLTQAIDQMPWAQRRGAINRELKGAVEPSGELQAAMMQAEGPKIPKGQRGAIDVQAVEDGFQAIRDGKVIGYLRSNLTPEQSELLRENANVDIVRVDPSVKGTGVGKALYDAWSQAHGGRIAPSGKTSPDAWKVWKRDYPEKVNEFAAQEAQRLQDGASRELVLGNITDPDVRQRVAGMAAAPRSQRGAVDFNAVSDAIKKFAGLTQSSPEVSAAKDLLDVGRKVEATSKIIPGLEWARPKYTTPESVLADSAFKKDISWPRLKYGQSLAPGARKMRRATENPLISYVSEMTARDGTEAENFARQYITGPEGIKREYGKMSPAERAEVHSVLLKGDKYQQYITRDQMTSAGFNENQIRFVEKLYEMNKVKLDYWNEKRLEVGMDPVRERPGTFNSVFRGDYKSLVVDGEGQVVGYIGNDTKWGYKQQVDYIKKNHPDYKITEMKRTGLTGHRAGGDVVSGMRDLLNFLSQADPRVAQLQSVLDVLAADKADAVYGASKHSLEKKGIFGAEGRKPWLDATQNADEAFKAFFRYWEEGMLSHANLVTSSKIDALLRNPELDHMPRAREYVQEYMAGLNGHLVGWPGRMMNEAIDGLAKTVQVGPSYARELSNQFNKRMGQKTMGWMNFGFIGSQFLQIPQTAIPELGRTAMKIGKDPVISVADAMRKGAQDGVRLFSESALGIPTKADAFERSMWKYAEDRGLLTFSEYEDVNKVTQGKISSGYDKVADIGRQLGEQGTRPYVFFSFVRLLEDSQLPRAEIFDTAYNLTQDAMYDYSARERPLGIKKLGVAGQTTGALTTFKLNYLDQMGRWTKEALKGDMTALIGGLAAGYALYGIGGLPFYQEADAIYKKLTDYKQSLADLVLKESGLTAPWANRLQYGAASADTGLNIQSRLSAADVLPNSPTEAITPYGKTAYEMGRSLHELATERDPLAVQNVARAFAPSSARGLVENMLQTQEGPQGSVTINKKGQGDYPRTEEDKFARYFGMTTLEEATNKQRIFEGTERRMADSGRQKEIEEKVRRALVQASPIGMKPEAAKARVQAWFARESTQELLQEYEDRGGDVQQLLQKHAPKSIMEGRQTTKQRMEGVPKSDVRSVHRYQYYNE